MITLFRKIRAKLITESKLSRYLIYAFGEIILVMVGILLALQVSNWNQERIASNKEKTLLSELHDEFVENKEQLKRVGEKHLEAYNACDSLIALFPIDFTVTPADSLMPKIFPLKRRWTFNPSQGIINSLVSTSSFELISNRELRKLLVSWNDVLVDFQEDELSSKKYVMEVLNPYLNKHFHYIKGSLDPRTNVSAFQSMEFENLVFQRKEYLIDIFGRDTDLEYSRIQTTIDRIIALSEPENP